MLIVINEFHIDPSKIKQATEAAKAAQAQIGKLGHKPHKILTDVTGEFYTLMFVGEFESLAALEKTMEGVMSNPDFRAVSTIEIASAALPQTFRSPILICEI